MSEHSDAGRGDGRVRYVVIGLGHISQVAVLPAFDHAEDAELVAIASSNDEKLRVLQERHQVRHAVSYDDLDRLLADGEIDAAYIAVPNHLHCEYTERVAAHGVHVLCEKPMAVSEEECRRMEQACEDNGALLMIAYRLHFEGANMRAAAEVAKHTIGEPRFFASSFSQDVKPGDVRLMPIEKGGGTVFDMGVYCINAARYLFRDEPVEVTGMMASRAGDDRFSDCDEMTSAVLRFPGDRLATFTSSFGAAGVSTFRVVGTEGDLRMEPAYGYATHLGYELTRAEERRSHTFAKRDQFAPELVHFSRCILEGRRPEPDAREGLADVRIINAIYESARSGQAVPLEPVLEQRRPDEGQVMHRPGVEEPDPVHATGPTR